MSLKNIKQTIPLPYLPPLKVKQQKKMVAGISGDKICQNLNKHADAAACS